MDEPPFYPLRILVGTTLIALLVAGFAALSLSSGVGVPSWTAPVLLVAATLVIKWAAPRVPWRQIGWCASAIVLVHAAAHASHWAPAMMLADKLIELLCLAGFGTYWVAKRYVPRWANR